MSKEITVTSKQDRIAPWGDRNEVREIAQRIQLMAPGAKKLNENQALALAQGAIAHGLDPFNGEIWFIPGSGLMAGIKGLRKAARQQIDGNFWTEFDEITDPDERILYMIPEGALAFRCTVRDSETIRAYSEAWKMLSKDEVPVKLIPEIIGNRPYTLGIGYIKAGEQTRMDPIQVAMKRSEADALKRRFDLPFAVPTEPNNVHTVEGDWAEFNGGEEDEVISTDQPNLFDGEADDRKPNQWEQPILDKLVELQLVQAKPHAVNILNKSPFMDVAPGKLEMLEAVAYIVGWTMTKKEMPDLESDERAELVNKAWASDHAAWTDKAIELLGGE